MTAEDPDRIGPDAEDHFQTYGVELVVAIVVCFGDLALAGLLWMPSAIAGIVGALFGVVGLAGPVGTATPTDHALIAVGGVVLFGVGFGLHEWRDGHWCDDCEQATRERAPR